MPTYDDLVTFGFWLAFHFLHALSVGALYFLQPNLGIRTLPSRRSSIHNLAVMEPSF